MSYMKEFFLGKYRFYKITSAVLIVWMLFFDVNDLFTQFKMYRELSHLQEEKLFYQKKLKDVEAKQKAVMGNSKLIEKFAREKYLMKKPKEEIFVIVDEDNQPLEK